MISCPNLYSAKSAARSVVIRPPYTPMAIEDHIYKQFDDDKYKMPSASHDKVELDPFQVHPAKEEASSSNGHIVLNFLLRKGETPSSLVGARVCSHVGTVPPLDQSNFNPFRRLFGITFSDPHGRQKTRIVSAYEYCHCWLIKSSPPEARLASARAQTNVRATRDSYKTYMTN
jgi:hypothetical protein